MSKRKVILWDCQEDAEELRHGCIDEAILDRLESDDDKPETLTVYGYAREIVDVADMLAPLEQALEILDESFGHWDESTDSNKAMTAAEKAFIEVLQREYIPQVCEVVKQVEIDVAKWCKDNDYKL